MTPDFTRQKHSKIRPTIALAALFVLAATMVPLPGFSAVVYPGPPPGDATLELLETGATLKNTLLEASYQWNESGLSLYFRGLQPATDAASGTTPFMLRLADGRTLGGGDFLISGAVESVHLPAQPEARRLTERFAGRQVRVTLRTRDGSVEALFTATLRDGANYVTQQVAVTPLKDDLKIAAITLLDLQIGGAVVMGDTQGSPVVAGPLFFACEHPLARNNVEDGRVVCVLSRTNALKTGATLNVSSVLGVTPPTQLRRGFLYYLERERTHPYRPFLHYNSWYDIAWGDRKFDEAQALEAINLPGDALVVKRGVAMHSFVFDDGWDDNKTLWQFHGGFPNGFTPLKQAAAGYQSAVGVWLSPFGGYGEAREQRLKYGETQGFEINRNGFSLAGEQYYARFHGICAAMIREYGVNFFKFDGMGCGNDVTGCEEFLDDIEALMRLTGELRAIAPDLYVSATTGTWCSPYFLWHADNTWRSAEDMNFSGKGSKRQQWVNYRDTHTFANVVQKGPLYPLNSLMTQGIVHGTHGYAALMEDNPVSWADEVWSFFGSGTNLQELYITPQRLTETMWDILARGANWSRENADILVDTHWVGGDPGKHQVYGWAAWSPRKGILVLRNPNDQNATLSLDIGAALELPDGAATHFSLSTPRPDQRAVPGQVLKAGEVSHFELMPFEVLVFELQPKQDF